MELKPRLSTGELVIRAFNSDITRFGRFLDLLNESLKGHEGEYTQEDVFSFLLSNGLEQYPDLKAKVDEPVKKRGRKKAPQA